MFLVMELLVCSWSGKCFEIQPIEFGMAVFFSKSMVVPIRTVSRFLKVIGLQCAY